MTDDNHDEINREEFNRLLRQVNLIDEHGSKAIRNQLQVHHDKVMFWSVIMIFVCFIAFAGLNVGFVVWQVTNSEHVWCQVIDTLNKPPSPAGGTPESNPARAYDQQLSHEFQVLKGNLGC